MSFLSERCAPDEEAEEVIKKETAEDLSANPWEQTRSDCRLQTIHFTVLSPVAGTDDVSSM